MKRIPSFKLSDKAYAILNNLQKELKERGVKGVTHGKVLERLILRYGQLLEEVEDTKPP